MPSPTKTRILSIDGGGSWALIPALALAEIYGENTRGHDILRDFDYVAANSGGSLVVAGLVENRTPGEICDFFLNEAQRQHIFHRLPWPERSVRFLLNLFIPQPRYSTRHKLQALNNLFHSEGQKPLSELQVAHRTSGQSVRFVFMSYDYRRDRAGFLRSYASLAASPGTRASDLTLAEAVHASTNAPIYYFDKPAESRAASTAAGPNLYWDGGLSGYNNPVLAAVIEAVANGVPRETIAALSLGTARVSLPLPGKLPANSCALLRPQPRPGAKSNIIKVASSILADPPDAHSFIAHVLLGGAIPPLSPDTAARDACPVVRLNPLIEPKWKHGQWHEPEGLELGAFQRLVKLDMDATENHDVHLIQQLFMAWKAGHVRNQDIRPDNLDRYSETHGPQPDIGHDKFADAVQAWRAIA